MGTSGQAYVSGRPHVPVLQLLCNTSSASYTVQLNYSNYIYDVAYTSLLWVSVMMFNVLYSWFFRGTQIP